MRTWADWHDLLELFDGAPPDPLSRQAMLRLTGRPGFGAAVEASARRILAAYRHSPAANRILNDRGRLVLSILLLDLHHRAQAGEGDATLARLKDICSAHRVCSPGRTAAMIGAMRLFGFVTLAPTPDRRARRLLPSPAFERLTRDRWAALLDGAVSLVPSAGAIAARMEEPAVMAAFVRGLAQRFFDGYRAVNGVPRIAPFIERDGGLMVLFSLYLAGREAASSGGFTIAETARRFQLSRAHVASVVNVGAAQDLVLRSGPRDALIRPTPRLAELVETFLASAYLMHAVGAHDAAVSLGLAGKPMPGEVPEAAGDRLHSALTP